MDTAVLDAALSASTTGELKTAASNTTNPDKGRRLTLMIGWWATDVCSGGRCEEYGPSAPLPHGAQWVKELHSDVTIEAATKDGRDRVEPYDAVVREVQPAWLDVQAVKHTSSQPHDYADRRRGH